jgi:hypothetical protein
VFVAQILPEMTIEGSKGQCRRRNMMKCVRISATQDYVGEKPS